MRKLPRAIRIGILLGLGLLATALIRSEPAPGTPATPPYVTYFLIDGLSQEVFQRELAAGRLPHIQQLIAEGTYVEDGIAAFPSMTGYGFYPFLTGRDAARSGVLGLRWFDRSAPEGNFRNYVGRTNRAMNGDFQSDPRTLFERFPGTHSFSVNSYANRGVTRSTVLGWDFSMAKYREQSRAVRVLAGTPWLGPRLLPDWFGAEDATLQAALDDLPHRPKTQWLTFASPDGRHHITGMDDTYVQLVRHIDTLIGRYRAESRRLGQEAHRIYAVISDHGVVDVKRNVDLRQAVKAAGLSAWRGDATHLSTSELSEPLSTWAEHEVIIAVNGNTMNYVYLRDPGAGAEGWQRRPPASLALAYPRRAGAPVNLVDTLLAAEGVELVALRAEAGEVRLYGRNGQGSIRREAAGYSYRCEGEDPLGYAKVPAAAALCDGQGHGAAEWLAATHATAYPDAVGRLHSLMSAPDVGDLVVLAPAGYDLAADYELVVGNYHGGHGGLRADQLRVPYLLAGPGVPRGLRIPAARAEDVGATVLKLVGQSAGPDAEGQPLF